MPAPDTSALLLSGRRTTGFYAIVTTRYVLLGLALQGIFLTTSGIESGSAKSFPTPTEKTEGRDSAREALLAELQELIRKGKWKEGDQKFIDYIERTGGSADLYFRIGRLYFEHERWDRAAEQFRQSLQYVPHQATAHFLLGLALTKLGESEAAKKELDLAISHDAQNDLYWYMAGHLRYTQQRYKDALPYFYQALKRNPNNIKALQGLALTHAHLGNYALAESSYKRAIQAADTQGASAGEIPLDLAFLLLLSQDRKKADEGLMWAERAVALDPSSSAAYYLLGKALFRLGRTEKAIRALQNAVDLDPKNSKPHYLLGRIHFRTGEREKAESHWQAFVRLNQGNQGD